MAITKPSSAKKNTQHPSASSSLCGTKAWPEKTVGSILRTQNSWGAWAKWHPRSKRQPCSNLQARLWNIWAIYPNTNLLRDPWNSPHLGRSPPAMPMPALLARSPSRVGSNQWAPMGFCQGSGMGEMPMALALCLNSKSLLRSPPRVRGIQL